MVMLFPGPHPDFRTKYLWMERHKVHGQRPVSTSKVAVWGAWNKGQTGWSNLIAFSDPDAAAVYSEKLADTLSGSDTQTIDKLTKHWVRGCYYIYCLALNNTYMRLSDTTEAIDDLVSTHRFSPSTAIYSLNCHAHENHHRGTRLRQSRNLEAPLRVLCS